MERFTPDEKVDRMPLPQLVELCQKRFKESKVIEKAAHSSLYKEKWAVAGVVAEQVRTYADLRKVPYTTGSELREAQAQHHPDELVCGDNVQLWISTSGTTGIPKWIPVSDEDFATLGEASTRLMGAIPGATEGSSFLFISGPAPFIGEWGGYRALIHHILDDSHMEFAYVAMPETFDALNFARMAETQGMFTAPSLAVLIAEGVAERAAEGAREQFRKERSLRNLLGVLATTVMNIKAKHVFKFEWGTFGGEPVDPYRSAITEAYGLQPTSAYSATEAYTVVISECEASDGMHLYMDFCLPEIIPQPELEREETDASYVPQAIPLWEAVAGQTGELVLTTFADALPLIRYRISDLIEVVSTEPCTCGGTHPRIKVLHRSDDIVNLGLIRFSIYLLKEKLEEIGVHGGIAKWQLRVTREDYKPKALLLVKPTREEISTEAFVEEIRDKIDEIEGVRQGWENGLIAEPEVRLVEELEEQRTSFGKVKLAIYEDAYFEEA